MSVTQTLNNILESVLKEHPGVFLVDSKHQQQSHEFILDADEAIGIATISGISRSLNHFAEEQIPAEENYTIDVTSPGADSPLKLLRQFPKHVGRSFEITLNDNNKFSGKLLSVTGDQLTFEYSKSAKPKKNEPVEALSVPYNQIKKATIILSFK